MPEAIALKGVGKRYRRYDPERVWTFEEALFRRLRGHRPAERVWVLRDINLSVARGETVGLIGRNGAGKSTLLRLIGGIGRPDEGKITVNGRISALLDLGVGFHPDLTGRENVFISGVVGGLTRAEVAERFDSIVDFAELQGSIANPLRTYSSGMHMRLAFSVAIHTDPEILLVDEVLAVGDIAFQQKCLDRIADFKRKGCTIAMVSHDPALISEFCDRALWLSEGRVQECGSAPTVVAQYVHEMETLRRTPNGIPPLLASSGVELRLSENRFGSLEVELQKVRVLDSYGQPTTELIDHGPVIIELEYSATASVQEPIFGVTILNSEDRICYDTNSEGLLEGSQRTGCGGTIEMRLEDLDLPNGRYYVDVGAYRRDWAYTYDYHWKAYPLSINVRNGDCETKAGTTRASWRLR